MALAQLLRLGRVVKTVPPIARARWDLAKALSAPDAVARDVVAKHVQGTGLGALGLYVAASSSGDRGAINDERSYNGQPMVKPSVHRPGELLFEFVKGHTRIRCELRDQGPYGWEAQFLHNEELVIGRTFHQRNGSKSFVSSGEPGGNRTRRAKPQAEA
jgi:hypothetical protein